MTRSEFILPLAVAFLAGGLGALAAAWTLERARDEPVARPLACRPSLPAHAFQEADGPVVLYLGNSLVFDHDWNIAGTAPVNCGRQGMVAADLDAAQLPETAPGLVVVGFGTVEILRASGAGTSVDLASFEHSIVSVLETVQRRYPAVPVMVLGVPSVPLYPEADVAGMNDLLERVARERSLIWAPHPRALTYDGIHLAREEYRPWHGQIATALGLN